MPPGGQIATDSSRRMSTTRSSIGLSRRRAAVISAVLFFVFWLAVLYAGADHPPPRGFILVALLDLIAASLVFWRVPYYLDWMQTRRRRRLLWVVRDGLIAGLVIALLGVLASALIGGGEPTVTPSIGGAAIWVAVLAGVGVANALALYGVSAMLRKA
jgi:FtsH-binding integral membrane protein